MAPRGDSVNEEMRRRSRDRIMRATIDLVDQRGYAATTLADIAEQAGLARGLVSYYFDGKRFLMQSATHRLMHLTLAGALEELPARATRSSGWPARWTPYSTWRWTIPG